MKYFTRLTSLVLLAGLFAACGEKPAEIENPRDYKKGKITFQYPGNWEVTEDVEQAGIRSVIIESPGDAVLILQTFPANLAPDIKTFAKIFAAELKKEVPVGEVGDSKLTPREKDSGFEVLKDNFALTLAGEKIPHTRFFHRKKIGQTVSFIVTQVSDEDLSLVEKGFAQVVSSAKYQ